MMSDYGAIEFFRYDPQLYALARRMLERTSLELLNKHGPVVAQMPRSAAVAHEVGHVIVGAYDKRPISSTRIFKYKKYTAPELGPIWCGITDSVEFICSPDTEPEDDLRHACYLIGGLAGEAVLDPPEREGSSLDETIASQIIVTFVANGKLGMETDEEAFQLWETECWRRAKAIVQHNKGLAAKLSVILERDRCIKQPRLGELLSEVLPCPAP